jgi:diguanylate cyclase (GGDEF)-like protein
MALTVLPLLLIAASGYLLFGFAMESMEESHDEIRDELLPVLRLQELILKAQMPGNDYLIHGDGAEREKFEHFSAEVDAAFEEALAAPFGVDGKRQALLEARNLWIEGAGMSRTIFALPDPVGDRAGAELMIRMDAQMQAASDHLKVVSALALTEMDHRHAGIHALHLRVSLSIAVFLGILLIAVFTGWILIRKWIIDPLSELENGAQMFTAGKLEHRIPVKSADEIGSIARALNDMALALKHDRDILRNLSSHDQLTGLLNRREFQRLLDLEVARSQRHGRVLALLLIDLDYFKSVNDRYGHPAGDAVLKCAADRFVAALRPNDFVARYGGEEFIVLLPETDAAGAVALAERLCAQVRAAPMDIGQGIAPVVTTSIGIAVYPSHADTAEDLITAADQALYAAKAAGRDRCSLIR